MAFVLELHIGRIEPGLFQRRQIREAIDAYKKAADEGKIARQADESGYPRRLEELSAGVEDLKSPGKRKIYFLRRLPSDPMFGGAYRGCCRDVGKTQLRKSTG